MADHDHVHLQYQPALPINNGKVCLWLFLSTEIMFFAALIGTYIVIRFGAVAWPTPHDVHVKEVIGGFYVIDVANLDEAIEWAARIPNVHFGTVEVRPVVTWDD